MCQTCGGPPSWRASVYPGVALSWGYVFHATPSRPSETVPRDLGVEPAAIGDDALRRVLVRWWHEAEQRQIARDLDEQLAQRPGIERGVRKAHDALRRAGVRDTRCYMLAGMDVARRLGMDEVLEQVNRRAEHRRASWRVEAARFRRMGTNCSLPKRRARPRAHRLRRTRTTRGGCTPGRPGRPDDPDPDPLAARGAAAA